MFRAKLSPQTSAGRRSRKPRTGEMGLNCMWCIFCPDCVLRHLNPSARGTHLPTPGAVRIPDDFAVVAELVDAQR